MAAGGDGTLNELVAAMVRYGAPPSVSAALVPFGTANDFAAATGISQVGGRQWPLLLLAGCVGLGTSACGVLPGWQLCHTVLRAPGVWH